MARLGGLTYKMDFLLNENNQVIRAFFGDPVDAHRQGADHANSLYLVRLPKQADVVITSVITSYSIHYTKLYEVPPSPGRPTGRRARC